MSTPGITTVAIPLAYMPFDFPSKIESKICFQCKKSAV
jgi:hypothetical protein